MFIPYPHNAYPFKLILFKCSKGLLVKLVSGWQAQVPNRVKGYGLVIMITICSVDTIVNKVTGINKYHYLNFTVEQKEPQTA